ncbi:MAG: TatD family hydrolase [Candidatus Jordarchaeales archaeon]
MIADAHCHMDLYEDINSVVERARGVGVSKIVSVAIDLGSMQKILEIADTFRPIVEPALGLHPIAVNASSRMSEVLEESLAIMEENADRMVAVGEIGLDRYESCEREVRLMQEKVFRTMLDFAAEKKLPVIIHSYKAERRVFDVLEEYEGLVVIIHWFTGPAELLEKGIERNYYFSVTPAIKYSGKVRRVARRVPLDNLLCESDGPVEYKGLVGEPADCRMVVEEVAKVRGLNFGEVAVELLRNFKAVFKRAK